MLRRILFLLSIFPVAAIAGGNPFTGDYQNQFMMGFGQGTSARWMMPFDERTELIPFAIANFQYSQPNTFFRLPGRQNINISRAAGWDKYKKWNFAHYSQFIATISQDIALYSGSKFYCGVGGGFGMQEHENRRIGTKLVFQFKTFVGQKISKRLRAELFTLHFSNGSTSEANDAYNFFGAGAAYNF